MSMAEKRRYDYTLQQAKRDIDVIVSTSQGANKYTKLFTMILKLRMICNHGTYLKHPDSPQSIPDTSQSFEMSDLQMGNDMTCDVCHDLEPSNLIEELDICPSCYRLLPARMASVETGPANSPNKRRKLSPTDRGTHSDRTWRPPQSSSHPSSSENDHPIDGCSTKLQAVANNLVEHDSSSKRSFMPYFSMWTANH